MGHTDDLNEMVDGFLKPKPDSLTLTSLVDMIRETIEESTGILLSEATDAVKGVKEVRIEDMLGALNVDIKNWGTRGSSPGDDAVDRKIVQNYVQTVASGGSGPDDILRALEESFNNLSQASSDRKQGKCDLAKTISTIQLLNTLSAIINQFEPRAAGFIMEAFLAALFPGGAVVGVSDSEGIEDFVVQGEGGDLMYSLKTYAAGKGFDGSKIDLVKSMRASPQNEVIYYVFGKVGGKGGESVGTIYAHKFVIDESNIVQVLGGEASYQTTLKQIEMGNSKWDPSLNPEGASFGSKPGTFKVPSKLYYNDQHLIATLTIDNAKLVEIANEHLKDIVQQLIEIQNQFKKVVYDMNLYLATMSGTKAEEFKADTKVFNQTVQANVEGDNTCMPPEDIV